MGARLHVDGHRTGIPLPFIVIEHLPLLNSSVASRWVTYFWLFAALLLALLLDAVVQGGDPRPVRAARCRRVVRRARRRRALAPRPGLALCKRSGSGPALVHQRRTLPPGGVGRPRLPVGQLVERLVHAVAGHGQHAVPTARRVRRHTGLRRCQHLQRRSFPAAGRAGPVRGRCVIGADFPAADVRAQLQQWRTGTVAVVPTAPGAACATALFTAALGPPKRTEGVLVWPNLDRGS